jgi:hypothetical protein
MLTAVMLNDSMLRVIMLSAVAHNIQLLNLSSGALIQTLREQVDKLQKEKTL